jgi:hypothetical protein
MRNILTLTLVLALAASGLWAQQAPFTSVFFQTASYALDSLAQSKLSALAQEVGRVGDAYVRIEAHADTRGRGPLNAQLAAQRAGAVAAYLRELGVPADALEPMSFGDSRAQDDGVSEALLQSSRRADVWLERQSWQDMAALRDALQSPFAQTFTVSADKDTLLVGAAGGRFFIPADCFSLPSGGKAEGLVDIQLTESYTLGDMVAMGLITASGHAPLETGGMWRMTATQGGNDLSMRAGQSILAAIPTDTLRADMTLFYGAHVAGQQAVDWQNTEVPVTAGIPRLRLAPAPQKPGMPNLMKRKFLDEPEPKGPTPPTMSRPVRPLEPDYAQIKAAPKGLKKLTTSKAALAAQTDTLREQAKQAYQERLTRYDNRMMHYQKLHSEFQIAKAAFDAEQAAKPDSLKSVLVLDEEWAGLADSIYARAMVKYVRDSTAYEGYRAVKVRQYTQMLEQLETLSASAVSTYFSQVNNLGWCNIDRLMRLNKAELSTQLLASVPPVVAGSEARVCIVFPERKAVLDLRKTATGAYEMKGLPKGEKAVIVAWTVADGKLLYATQHTTIADVQQVDLPMQPGRLTGLKDVLAGL